MDERIDDEDRKKRINSMYEVRKMRMRFENERMKIEISSKQARGADRRDRFEGRGASASRRRGCRSALLAALLAVRG